LRLLPEAGLSPDLFPFAAAVRDALPADSGELGHDTLLDLCGWLAESAPDHPPLSSKELAFLRSLDLSSPEDQRLSCPTSDDERREWLTDITLLATALDGVRGLAETVTRYRDLLPGPEHRHALEAVLALTTASEPLVVNGFWLSYRWDADRRTFCGYVVDLGVEAPQLEQPTLAELEAAFSRWVEEYLRSVPGPSGAPSLNDRRRRA
jgi:hypothetical protein